LQQVACTEDLVKFGHVVLEISKHAQGCQTDRQTTSSQYLIALMWARSNEMVAYYSNCMHEMFNDR